MNQIKDKKLIAFSGLARSGKNSFANELQKQLIDCAPNLKVQQFSFAESLRQELNSFVKENFDISVFTEDSDEKSIIRPILIAYGNAKRVKTNNQYWIENLHRKIEKSDCDIAIITDLRYAQSTGKFNDELDWFKSHNGKLIHIRRFVFAGKKKVFQPAPNEFEKENDPILQKAAFKSYQIPMMDTKEEFFSYLKEECSKLLGYFL